MQIKKRIKKGFTLVELVVVIAVIAILAAVSVGAYFGITVSANRSADEQAVTQMNTMLETYEIINGKVDDVKEAKDIFEDNGLTNYTPFYGKNTFYWTYDDARVIIWEEEKGVTYPSWAVDKYKDYSSVDKTSANWYDLNINQEVFQAAASVDDFISQVENAPTNSIISFEENSVYNFSSSQYKEFRDKLATQDGKNIIIDMNGSTFNVDKAVHTDSISHKNVTILNGSFNINSVVNNISYNLFSVGDYASLSLKNVNINGGGTYTFCSLFGPVAELIIEDSTITNFTYFGTATNAVQSSYITMKIKNSLMEAGIPVFSNANSVIDVENSDLQAWQCPVALRTGVITVNNSILYNNDTTYTNSSDYYYQFFADNYGQFSQGNMFPTAVALLGNYTATTGYNGPVTATFKNTTFKSEDKVHVPDMLLAADNGTNVYVTHSNCTLDTNNIVQYEASDNSNLTFGDKLINNTGTIQINGTLYNYTDNKYSA